MADVTLIVPYCTEAWAEQYYSEYLYDENWSNASDEKKLSAVKCATAFFDIFVVFYDDGGNEITYAKSEDDDWNDEINPRLLKRACAEEGAYLLSLDDNPAEPHPLTILGMISADGRKFDKAYVPPIFPVHVAKMLEMLGGVIDPDAVDSNRMIVASKQTEC